MAVIRNPDIGGDASTPRNQAGPWAAPDPVGHCTTETEIFQLEEALGHYLLPDVDLATVTVM